ncbi:MAG: YHS domain-containing protein [Candidatus Limnocylindria bacterium]
MTAGAIDDRASKETEMREPTVIVVDPVCGMAIDADQAIRLDHEGRTYYFCDPVCVDTFRDEPGRWTQAVPTAIQD